VAEAKRGAEAEADGADCLAIDAESTYEGRYASASVYMAKLRVLVGERYPLALASFPYVDYHPGLPYSVFLGPGAAQVNLPQLYWRAIGTTVAQGYLHTFEFNRVYRRPIRPLGQTYQDPPLRQLSQFRRYALSYGFAGVSWWSWQETSGREWRRLARPVTTPVQGFVRPQVWPVLGGGRTGDLVVWAQEHLLGAGEDVIVSGRYGKRTAKAVRAFQLQQGLPVTGAVDTATWPRLLNVTPTVIDWSQPRSKRAVAAIPSSGKPLSASAPAIRDEIPQPPRR
jgi:hypothetical protein